MAHVTTGIETPGYLVSASSPSRPTSSYTLHSTFADSAVDMDATAPVKAPQQIPSPSSALNSFDMHDQLSADDVDQTLSDKMRRLAAVAWTLEQGDDMTPTKRSRLHKSLLNLESQLDSESENRLISGGESHPSIPEELVTKHVEHGGEEEAVAEEEDIWIDESDLIAVRESLTTTVKAMRMRHEEQSHLHNLTAQKLEAVAQRCIDQERKFQQLLDDMRHLRAENEALGRENDELRQRTTWLEDEASRNEVAVEAMSSAVAGLEGWIESSPLPKVQTPVTTTKTKRQRVVIRGKGRFRGRYYVDEDGDPAIAYSLTDAAAETQEFHDGVKAWLRGFRDVEEEVRHHDSPTRTQSQGRFRATGHSHSHHEDDDWGDFQSVQRSE